MYNLYVHVTYQTVICNWGKPLCGFDCKQFREGRFYHPETKVYLTATTGMKIDYQKVSHAIQVALQDEGLAVSMLRDTLPKRKRKCPKVDASQPRLKGL